MSNLKIGEKIKAKRREREFTQEELAAILGVSKAAVSKWENGESYPDVEMLPQIAQLFHMSMDELFDFSSFDIERMVERLKASGVRFTDGLTPSEIREIERTFGFRFPKEIADFLSYAYPTGSRFFRYNDLSDQNVAAFQDFQKGIRDAFLFDLENNGEALSAMLRKTTKGCYDTDSLRGAILDQLNGSPRLIPFYGHRCFFDGMDHMPIVSFSQPIDTIFYGSDFENYLENEFLASGLTLGKISDRMKDTGIWYYIVE